MPILLDKVALVIEISENEDYFTIYNGETRIMHLTRIVGVVILGIGLLTGCSVIPVASDTEGPNITMTQVSRGEVEVFASTDGSAIVPAPDVCPSGTLLLGWVRQIDQFPVEVLISAADESGVRWLRLNTGDGVISSADPATVSISTRDVGGTEYYIAQEYYPEADPRSARLFKVMLEPKPGETIVSIEGGAMDFNGNQTYSFVIPMGTNEGLCEEYE